MILGVDIGNKGAIALIDSDKIVDIIDMPVINNNIYFNKDGKPALIVDACKLSSYLKSVLPVSACVIEEPITPFNKTPQSITNSNKRSIGYGMVRACVEMQGVKLINVKPAKWKKALSITKDKQTSIDACHNIFGESAKKFIIFKVHDGRAEASLIAWYGLKCLDLK
jgi:hypothetical protein